MQLNDLALADHAGNAPVERAELEALSKDQLIEMHRRVYGNVGDSGRTSKDQYIDRLLNHDSSLRPFLASLEAPMARLAPKAAQAPVEAAQQLLSIVQSLSAGALDESRVKAIVDEGIAAAVGKIEPRVIHHVVTPRSDLKIDEHTHPLFPKVLKLLAAGLTPLLVGPTGCGKTHLARQVARAMNLTYGEISGSAGVSESELTGWLLPIAEGGRFEYMPAPFVTRYTTDNSLFCVDELDGFDPNMLLTCNTAIENGSFFIAKRYENPMVKRGANVHIVAAANTFGTGADMIYAGRNQLDEATLSRFYKVRMDYDQAFEKQVSAAHPEVAEWVWVARDKINGARLRRVLGTRTVQQAVKALDAGLSWKEVKADLLAGWTRDELAKIGE